MSGDFSDADMDVCGTEEVNQPAISTVKLSPTVIRAAGRYKWLGFSLASASLYAAMIMLVTSLAGEIDPTVVAFSRTTVTATLALIVACYNGTNLSISTTTEMKFHAMNSALNAINIFTQFYAYTRMPAADANAIIYSQVVFVGLFGRLFLKESFGLFEISTVVIATVGCILIARPTFLFQFFESATLPMNNVGVLPPLLAFMGCLTGALTVIIARAMRLQEMETMKIMFYAMLFASVALAFPVTLLNQWSNIACTWARLRLVMMALSAFLAYALYNHALKFENCVYVSVVILSNVFMVYLVSIAFFNFEPNWTSVVGMLLIMGAAIGISIKNISTNRKN